MVVQTTLVRRSNSGKSVASCALADEGMTASGRPSVETTTWCLVPDLPRSVGFGPVIPKAFDGFHQTPSVQTRQHVAQQRAKGAYGRPNMKRSCAGRINSPPCLARTEPLSASTSHAAPSGPERAMRTRTAWTGRSKSVLCHSSGRRRVEPEARPSAVRNSRHWTPSRRKKRSVPTTPGVGIGGCSGPRGRSTIWPMTSATKSATVGPMPISLYQRRRKPTPDQRVSARRPHSCAKWTRMA